MNSRYKLRKNYQFFGSEIPNEDRLKNKEN